MNRVIAKGIDRYTNELMKYDKYGEVINHPDTYEAIANNLKAYCNTLVGWTDGNMTHFDVLFTVNVEGYGNFQGGVRAKDLFVSVMRRGAFGFEKEKIDTHAGYYDEKLGGGMGSTSEALAELINGVKKLL